MTVDWSGLRGYRVAVIDPPWPVDHSMRTKGANYHRIPYRTMPLREIAELPVPDILFDDAHVFVWTTQRFLPFTIDQVHAWRLKYLLTMVWHKPGGPTPFWLPTFNCEFVVVAVQGTPRFPRNDQFLACFDAPTGRHSEKPAFFYEMIARVTHAPRIDLFARRQIPGFDVWGDEVGLLGPAPDAQPSFWPES